VIGRRQALDGRAPAPATHAGLWLEQGLAKLKENGSIQEHLVELTESVRVPAGYLSFFERWKRSVQALPPFTQLAEAEVQGRLVVGLGAESILETAITLHRTYGVPYLPGSALKGLAAAAAHRHLAHDDWRKAGPGREIGPSHRVLFGDLGDAGWVTFHDALWIPAGDRLPLDPDVMTVHHAPYYRGEEEKPPADWDSPNPVSFLTARGRYLLALTGPEPWVNAALAILTEALKSDGLGAKTAAGYGRMIVKPPVPVVPRQGPSGGDPAKRWWDSWVGSINPGNATTEVPRLLRELTGEDRRQAAQRVARNLRDFLRTRGDREWVQALRAAAE
jgi:CRISPR-associated protein Cmr6